MDQKEIYELLAEKLGDAALGFDDEGVEAHADVAPDSIAEACTFLRDDERLQFNQLMCLSGIDWDGLDENGKGKSVKILGYTDEGQPETSDHVSTGDFGVAYHLYSHTQRHKFTLRVRTQRDRASVPSVAGVWSTAAWHEREAWDLVGIRFEGHPDLRRILLEEHWEGHPLRKDYQMPDNWNNVPLYGQPYCENPFPTTEPDPTPDQSSDKSPDGSPDKPADDGPAEG
jgi:NADH-quinone oxidoreductase subunit C